MQHNMYYGEGYKKIPVYSTEPGKGVEVCPDVWMFTDRIANVIFIGQPGEPEFVLVDTGMPKRADDILKAAKERFGEKARAKAIILTHGHFDHVGSVIELVEAWDSPVYAHPLEFPYLTGQTPYPKPAATGTSGVAVFLEDPINIEGPLRPLPEDGTVPELPDFKWILAAGHTPGQIVLYRENDGLLLSGDAFVTTQQENLFDVTTYQAGLSGPPRHLTPDWEKAGTAVQKIQQLQPKIVIAGHGQPMMGEELERGLDELVNNWMQVGQPNYGKYEVTNSN